MAKYSFDDNIYPEHAPYQPSRSALRRRFGNRAIVSKENDTYGGRPGSDAARALAIAKGEKAGFTEEATWRQFFSPRAPMAPPVAPPVPATPSTPSPSTFYNEQNPFGTTTVPSAVTSGTRFVNRLGYGGVRSAADVKAGRFDLTPQEGAKLSAWDAFLKSPAPAAPPQTSLDLLPTPRSGSPIVSMRPSDFSTTPTADGAFPQSPLTLSRLAAKRSPWEEPI